MTARSRRHACQPRCTMQRCAAARSGAAAQRRACWLSRCHSTFAAACSSGQPHNQAKASQHGRPTRPPTPDASACATCRALWSCCVLTVLAGPQGDPCKGQRPARWRPESQLGRGRAGRAERAAATGSAVRRCVGAPAGGWRRGRAWTLIAFIQKGWNREQGQVSEVEGAFEAGGRVQERPRFLREGLVKRQVHAGGAPAVGPRRARRSVRAVQPQLLSLGLVLPIMPNDVAARLPTACKGSARVEHTGQEDRSNTARPPAARRGSTGRARGGPPRHARRAAHARTHPGGR